MTQLRIGAGPFPPKRKRFLETFDIVELSDTFYELPKASTLQGWKKDAPDDFAFSLVCSQWVTADNLDFSGTPPEGHALRDLGFFQPTEAVDALWGEMIPVIEACGASHVLFKTPASFSPSVTNRENMKAFAQKHLCDVEFVPVWEPRGIWTPDEARELASELGMITAVDPFAELQMPQPPQGPAYYVLTGPSGRRDFSRDDYFDLLDFVEEHEHPLSLVFRGQDRDRNAFNFKKLVDAQK